MRKVSVVIGSNYGDEGKGLVTDYLASDRSVVVRFNGGAQAGHTVVDPDGRRHVFHHFGSGTLRGAQTYLSRFFYVNPLLFWDEWEQLRSIHARACVMIDPSATVTVPFDVMINQAIETKRGAKRHGSCGVGVWETQVRNTTSPYTFPYSLNDRSDIMSLLEEIRTDYVPKRLSELGLTPDDLPHLENRNIDRAWTNDLLNMHDETVMLSWKNFLFAGGAHEDIVFEGAQGLRLSELNVDDMPYLTPSKTGLHNVAELLRGYYDPVDVYYVTRPYFTRHGAGPLNYQFKSDNVDTTNVENEWQGEIRYGWFHIDEWLRFVHNDLIQNLTGVGWVPKLAITHMDTPGPVHTASDYSDRYYADTEHFAKNLLERSQFRSMIRSYGPTRNDVRT